MLHTYTCHNHVALARRLKRRAAAQPEVQAPIMPAVWRARKIHVNIMLKIFTLRYEEGTESFNDGAMSSSLSGKEILQWESHFFERKNE